jgi:5'-3' exonuclease
MGVHGITRLLKERGWLAASSSTSTSNNNSNNDCGCSTRLFQEWNPYTALFSTSSGDGDGPPPVQVQPVPRDSTFLIDGNGLAFYLHGVAYVRHLRSIAKTTTISTSTVTSTVTTCPLTNTLSPSQITQALPCMLPLHLLKEVTLEYVTTLRERGIKLQVFWDGPARRFKARTNEKRRQRRQQDWANLQQYCLHGSIPRERNACQWSKEFPYSALFLRCVRYTLQYMAFVNMVDCQEEADVELAKRASGDPTAFVIGHDSDFFFYKDIQYIPFDSVYVSSYDSSRSGLAQFLGLEEEQMVELAILLGNDYVDPASLVSPVKRQDPSEVIAYLQTQDDNFLVEVSEKGALAVDYVRCLYNLQDMNCFPLDGATAPSHHDAKREDNDDDDVLNEIQKVISFPDDFPMNQTRMFPEDNSVRDAVLRCLQVYIDQIQVDGPSSLKQEHLDAFKASTTLPSEQDSPEMYPQYCPSSKSPPSGYRYLLLLCTGYRGQSAI